MNPWPRVDFGALVQAVRQPKCGPEDLSLWSGRCPEDELLTFFRDWPLPQMPYRLYEYASEIEFELDTLPTEVALLERARLFGESGDLALRRDGQGFLWHFVGLPNVFMPAGYDNKDYWQSYRERKLTVVQQHALLWGKEIRDAQGVSQGRWQEDRVGSANLVYPGRQGDERVVLQYREYLYRDHVEAVWWLRLLPETTLAQGRR
ncbi:MAG: hypothetical protein BWY63_02978 [Chloroflexi bacterium ADurb.Bin360]|nr:MAG: hypothetical protein BWY63_02978 [Chloroflexi bacterium ADurb.Bin360]